MVELQNINRLMQQEVTRQEFLQCLGVAILSFIGVSHALQSLHHGLSRPATKRVKQPSSYGYGSSAYGR